MGQIATFMGELGMSYDEVVNQHPYRNLVIMMKDKQRVCTGEKMEETTEEELGITFDE